MRSEDAHISDQDLLYAADGESGAHRAAQVHAHLEACWVCRARMAELEAAIVTFTRAHRQALDPQLPPVAGPRALLRAQLSEMESQSRAGSWRWLPRFTLGMTTAVWMALFAATVVGTFLVHYAMQQRENSGAALLAHGTVPNPRLTPGATRQVSMNDVCSMTHEEVIAEVSTSLRQRVLSEYGIVNARPEDYEIDYLIAPGLGGTEDIHNLWPEPYRSRTWNAYVKDALEEHLHQMVCAQQIDLTTAQHDIATNWIAAYKKYFHAEKPVSLQSHLGSMSLFGLIVLPVPFRRADAISH
jgi:hypothetical protein